MGQRHCGSAGEIIIGGTEAPDGTIVGGTRLSVEDWEILYGKPMANPPAGIMGGVRKTGTKVSPITLDYKPRWLRRLGIAR